MWYYERKGFQTLPEDVVEYRIDYIFIIVLFPPDSRTYKPQVPVTQIFNKEIDYLTGCFMQLILPHVLVELLNYSVHP